ncbi:DsbA family protein [Chelatococcus asaccharovorans]|uniref:Protein-disulfide isomerase n=1 Tax=Chelatococcus asaccharovorans TaxID=28210 RepID=A0A2V3UHG9_9HYPH|nr:DsbA family protein [Chelatococcus asaccharovorans]MBS7706619.1 DsbA family protein [Chelatococcus asaccharovorans]PXW64731.1 protein-disulfide isomerase [Chelatococcus asaccharovorans]CAH1663499.1 Protein-disulfide isomerase [Chelatococcus asaccharovorans]CAH1682771.1 Protein-disulfide isomerase [Chelatococcus asaccharovorans]
MTHLAVPVGSQDHTQGQAQSAVTLVEYGDYECPYCGEAYPILKAVQHAMGDQMRFVFRNFPISELHPHAVRAAEFAEAAAGLGRFWQAHDMLYENQAALTDADLFGYGLRLGLASDVVAEGLDGRFDAKIRSDFMGGVRSGVNGTPSLFINGLRYDGERDVDSLVDALRHAAREAIRPRAGMHR